MEQSGKWAANQLTKGQAIALYNNKIWETENWDKEKIFRTQLFQKRLFMPFDVFHEAAEFALKRPVYTHEFASHDNIVLEYLGENEAPTLEDIIDLIPAEKRIIIGI